MSLKRRWNAYHPVYGLIQQAMMQLDKRVVNATAGEPVDAAARADIAALQDAARNQSAAVAGLNARVKTAVAADPVDAAAAEACAQEVAALEQRVASRRRARPDSCAASNATRESHRSYVLKPSESQYFRAVVIFEELSKLHDAKV